MKQGRYRKRHKERCKTLERLKDSIRERTETNGRGVKKSSTAYVVMQDVKKMAGLPPYKWRRSTAKRSYKGRRLGDWAGALVVVVCITRPA